MHKHHTPALAAFALGEPVLPIGYLPSGRPVYPIAGGAEDGAEGGDGKGKEEPPTFEAITSQADLDKALGARLARERAKFEGFDDFKKKADEYDKAIEAARTDQEKAVEAAKSEGRTEALTAANGRLIAAEARALASEAKFRNPGLAIKALELEDVKVSDDGTVDAAAIKAKLKELSDADPYLLDDGKKPAPKPDKAQGGQAASSDASVSRGRDMFENRRGAKKTSA